MVLRKWFWRIIPLASTVTLALALAQVGFPQESSERLGQGVPYPPANFVGELTLSPDRGPSGTLVSVKGRGFPPNATMDLVWQTVKGSWVLKGPMKEEFHGRRFDLRFVPLGKVTTDATGRLEARFKVPEDYGFSHDVLLLQDGVIRNKSAFRVEMQARISPTQGPVGTPITIDVRGIGWQNLENSWMVIYDNRFTGWLSAVTTRGRARAVIPAVGRPGRHIIQIIHGSFTFPYMNMQQSPRPDRPTFTFEFTVTEGKPILPPPASSQGLPVKRGSPPPGEGAAIWTDPVSAPVGTPFKVLGRGLPPGETVEFTWATVVGNRVSGEGWADSEVSLGKAVVDEKGNISLNLTVPDDVGGAHPIIARIGPRVIGRTDFLLTPSAFDIEPKSGPVGTTIKIHLKGVGWTETANIYHIVYDNAYLGYACGFNSQGDVQVFLKATGEPGWHFIDLYPGIYRGRDVPGVQNFRIPQLTYALDHPGERLPAFRFAFLITK
jgi:hypothetical protein